MMVGRSGGKERTREEFKILIENSGLKLKRIKQTAAPFSIIEIVANS